MAKPTADAHKHISMCINTLVHLYHDNRYNRRLTSGCGGTLCVIKFQTSSGPVAENPHRHVILRACVSNSLFKVNKDLDFLKSILISGSRSCLGSEAGCLSVLILCTPSDKYRFWALMVENKGKCEQWISSLLPFKEKKKTMQCWKACLRLVCLKFWRSGDLFWLRILT